MIRHYNSIDGIAGYAEGDVLVCDDTGECSRAVRTGAGIQLMPCARPDDAGRGINGADPGSASMGPDERNRR